MNRAARRRQQRQHGRVPVVIAGAGIVAAELTGHRYEARPHAQLPEKVAGEHRWVAMGSWVLTIEQAAAAMDPDRMKFLDSENLMHLGIGCWDCEQALGEIEVGSHCAAAASDG